MNTDPEPCRTEGHHFEVVAPPVSRKRPQRPKAVRCKICKRTWPVIRGTSWIPGEAKGEDDAV